LVKRLAGVETEVLANCLGTPNQFVIIRIFGACWHCGQLRLSATGYQKHDLKMQVVQLAGRNCT
jgi:hypothetical protein